MVLAASGIFEWRYPRLSFKLPNLGCLIDWSESAKCDGIVFSNMTSTVFNLKWCACEILSLICVPRSLATML